MTGWRCLEAREALRAAHTERLSAAEQRALREHLDTCEACRSVDREERALTTLLVERLPRPRAPAALQQRMAALVAEGATSVAPETTPVLANAGRKARAPRWAAAVGALALAAAALMAVLRPGASEQNPLLQEVVNDHLRVLYAERPIEIESGGIHQVKPWFEGRLDFAPRVPFGGDDQFPLQGGAVSYVVDRKAAAFVFKRRLHTVSLFVFRSDGLPWPHATERALGDGRAQALTMRGFNVLLFRRQDLGYALVSDLNLTELSQLGDKIARP